MAKAFRSLRLDVTALHAMHVLRGGTCACPVCMSSETLTAADAPEPPDMVVMIKQRSTPAAAMRKVRTASAPPTIDRNQAPPPPDMVAIILKQGDRQ